MITPTPWRAWSVAHLAHAVGVAVGLAAAAPATLHAQIAPAANEQLLDRTVAIVGGQVVTQSDVDLAVTLGLVDALSPGAATSVASAVVDRALILHEVARFSPAEPDPAAVAARLAEVRRRAGGDDGLSAVLARGGFSASLLTAWVRDDLRITAYLDQRFASAGVPADPEIAAYADAHRDELEKTGVPASDVARVSRLRLVAERRRDLIGDWLLDLRRRTEVVEFSRGPG